MKFKVGQKVEIIFPEYDTYQRLGFSSDWPNGRIGEIVQEAPGGGDYIVSLTKPDSRPCAYQIPAECIQPLNKFKQIKPKSRLVF